MRSSVAAALQPFLARFEGNALDFMYADTRNLVTTGTGNLIDSGPRDSDVINPAYARPALALPWRHRGNGARASQPEIMDAWAKVKTRPDMGKRGGGTYAGYTDLYLDSDALDALFYQHAASDETYLHGRFPQFENWPADAQLGLLSMAWAMGPAFSFPNFQRAANAGDFSTAARESHSFNTAPARNEANAQLFENAADVLRVGADPAVLYYPGTVQSPGNLGGGGSGGRRASSTSSSGGGILTAALGAGAAGLATWFLLTKWGAR
jgi:GH24 family phage-related lysozyme (muramidase)